MHTRNHPAPLTLTKTKRIVYPNFRIKFECGVYLDYVFADLEEARTILNAIVGSDLLIVQCNKP